MTEDRRLKASDGSRAAGRGARATDLVGWVLNPRVHLQFNRRGRRERGGRDNSTRKEKRIRRFVTHPGMRPRRGESPFAQSCRMMLVPDEGGSEEETDHVSRGGAEPLSRAG